jgi:hypothetical protein
MIILSWYILYFYSPSKKGLSGFFRRDKFFKFPNRSKASSRNIGKSAKLFLFAEKVYRLLNVGKTLSSENKLSSIISVIKFFRGLKSRPLSNRLQDTSKCFI